MKYEDVKCENCGHTWGYHFDLNCNYTDISTGAGKTFKPKGYKLTDICEYCHRELQDHYLYMQCKDNYVGYNFEREEYQQLEDELFEI